MTSGGITSGLRRIRPAVLCLVLPALLAVVRVEDLDDRFGTYGFDFEGTIREPARRLLDGVSPYPSTSDTAALVSGNPSVYPPLPIELASPLARLGFDASVAIWTLLLVGAVVASLWVVGVRDWRCYSLALLCPPVVEGLFFGNVTVFLMLPLALAWRWRADALRVGASVGVAIAVKPLLLPLLGWLVLTRRARGLAVAAGTALSLSVASWAVLGFDGLRAYPRLLDRLEAVYGPGSASLPAAFSWVATGQTARQVVCLLAALVLIAVAVALRGRENGDLGVYSVMVGASILVSPIVWPHYLALLVVPLAVAFPRAGLPWLAPYALALIVSIGDRAILAGSFALLVLVMALLPVSGWATASLAGGGRRRSAARAAPSTLLSDPTSFRNR